MFIQLSDKKFPADLLDLCLKLSLFFSRRGTTKKLVQRQPIKATGLLCHFALQNVIQKYSGGNPKYSGRNLKEFRKKHILRRGTTKKLAQRHLIKATAFFAAVLTAFKRLCLGQDFLLPGILLIIIHNSKDTKHSCKIGCFNKAVLTAFKRFCLGQDFLLPGIFLI